MDSVYSTELHKFVEEYFNIKGTKIIEQSDNYFVVLSADGRREIYTYHARIAAENKEIKLLARGSAAFKAMIQECSSKTAFSNVKMSYTLESVRDSLESRHCCDLCPFFSLCEMHDICCDLCHCYTKCSTSVSNAELLKLGELKNSTFIKAICFIFSIELSNDYSLSQKIEKVITVLVDADTGKIFDNIPLNDIVGLQIEAGEDYPALTAEKYQQFLNTARKEAANILQNQLEVFKGEIEGPLSDKIRAITKKYEDEYIENYTKSTLDQLDQMQNEALKLCEREIKGYTINTEFHLKNVILLQTADDVRELIFKLKDTGREISVYGRVFLGRVEIQCSQCGAEIGAGIICSDGHILCKNCFEVCNSCGKIICDTCDNESHICVTCGEAVCTDCIKQCSLCGAVMCTSHAYKCSVCEKTLCIDCYEICCVCGNDICKEHTILCDECRQPACPDDTHICNVCGGHFCTAHILYCSICGTQLCAAHANISAYSGRVICTEHMEKCSVCGSIHASDETKTCSSCGAILCHDHAKECRRCKKVFCSEHISRCRSCGNNFCSCTPSVKCRLCGEEYCADCINSEGFCRACEKLISLDKEDERISGIVGSIPELSSCRKFYLGTSSDIYVLYAGGIIKKQLVVFTAGGKLLSRRDLNFMEAFLLRKNLVKKRSDFS